MDYIQVNVTALIPVEDLSHYEATTLDEAVDNQRQWFDDDSMELGDILDVDDVTVTFTAVQK